MIFYAIDLLDRVLSSNNMEIQNFQLLGVTCLMIYGKIFDIYPPLIDDWVEICDGAYDKNDIIIMEARVLETVNYNINTSYMYD